MSFFKFSALLYGILLLIERLWPLLLVLVIYYIFKKQWKEFKKHRDG
jgi:hypothetical protein